MGLWRGGGGGVSIKVPRALMISCRGLVLLMPLSLNLAPFKGQAVKNTKIQSI